MSAGAGMNQYESGTHVPDWLTVELLATVFDTPVPYFYATEESMATFPLAYYPLLPKQQIEALEVDAKIH